VGIVSCRVEIDDTTLWWPANTVAVLFKAQAEAVATAFRTESGVGDIIEDEIAIDLPVFEAFVTEAVARYQRATHPILRSLTVGFISTATVLLERAGGRLPDGTAEDLAAWARLRQQHSQWMSR
jgi:hypothetical protein